MITQNGKEIDILSKPGTRHFHIQFKTGGQLPDSLSGLYTSYTAAHRDVLIYLNQDKGKKKNDG